MLEVDLRKVVAAIRPLLMHISEYRVKKSDYVHLPNYRMLLLNNDDVNEGDRQALYVHSSIEDVSHISTKNKYIHLLKIIDQPLAFGYVPPRLCGTVLIQKKIEFCLPYKPFWFGDWNSKLPSLQNG